MGVTDAHELKERRLVDKVNFLKPCHRERNTNCFMVKSKKNTGTVVRNMFSTSNI